MKAVGGEKHDIPFFFTEPFREGYRTIVWQPDEEKQRALFFALLDKVGDQVDYLFTENINPASRDGWTRMSGGIYHEDLIELLNIYEEWFFNNGSIRFCAGPSVDDSYYFAYDEHGLFFIFDRDEKEMLLRLDIPEQKLATIRDGFHYHGVIVSEKDLAAFKNALKESSVFYEDEAEEGEENSPES